MSQFDLHQIPGLAIEGEEPVFSEPWEAQAFALVVALHQNGMFTWADWAAILGETIAEDAGETAYYQLWLQALEHLIRETAMLSESEIGIRTEEWRAALLATPHGMPIELERQSH